MLFSRFPVEMWNKVMNVNLNSGFHLIRLALPYMKNNKGSYGRIVNISSVHGVVGSINKSAYVAAKHALNGLTVINYIIIQLALISLQKVVALETASNTRITCNAICPGWVKTPLVEKQIETRAQQKKITIEEATADLLGEKQPSKRFTTPEAIGDMVVFLCSESGQNVTGSIQIMDGAWTTQ